MDKLTTFGAIAIGTKFVAPGETVQYTKTGERLATRTSDGRVMTVGRGQNVVPEFTATCADILNSWGRL